MNREDARPLTPRRRAREPHPLARRMAVFFCLCLSFVFVSAQQENRPVTTSLDALAPIQRQIELERERLASSLDEERRFAVERLGAMARPDASRAASRALTDTSAIVRATATRAVLSLPPDEAAQLLLPLLRDKDEFVRRETAYALGTTRSTLATDALAEILVRDKEAGVRGAAAVALGQIGDAKAVPVLSETLGRRLPATGIVNRFLRRKTEENEFVRRAAAVALGQIGSREGAPALISTLMNERAGDDVRREAARALVAIGDASAIPAFRAALTARDPYLSQLAYEALRRLDPANATRPTVEASPARRRR